MAFPVAPFTAAETADYLTHQLRSVGIDRPLFTDAAVKAAHEWALNDVPRLLRRVDILDGWSRFQHWYDPTHWPYHAFTPSREARQLWLARLVTQSRCDDYEY
jgi:hypothetical protein